MDHDLIVAIMTLMTETQLNKIKTERVRNEIRKIIFESHSYCNSTII